MKNNLKKKFQISMRRFYSTNSPCKEISNYIGINKNEFIDYINKNLISGMTIENFGSVWSLDHIVPIDLFNLNNENDLHIGYNYLNILPMFINDNRLKGASVHFSKIKLLKMKETIKDKTIDILLEKCNNHISIVYDKYL